MHQSAARRSTGSPLVSGLLVGLSMLIAGCGGDTTSSAPSTSFAYVTTPSGDPAAPEAAPCAEPVDDPDVASSLLDDADPGDVVCITGEGFADVDLSISRSGALGDPIRLIGVDGVVVRSVSVDADDVNVESLSVARGEGIVASGTRLTINANTVTDARLDGISCEPCAGALILGNTIERADGTGIRVSGNQIVIHGNTVTGSVRIEANDADGIRFFGSNHRITANTVADIKDDGYEDEPPHTDCFQTFDNGGKPGTTDTVIEGNTCRNVDHQCLIATAEEAGLNGALGRSARLRFVDNVCEVEGSQAVLIGWFPDVEVRGNRLTGPGLERAVYLGDSSINAWVADNDVQPGVPEVEADDSSQPGLRTT